MANYNVLVLLNSKIYTFHMFRRSLQRRRGPNQPTENHYISCFLLNKTHVQDKHEQNRLQMSSLIVRWLVIHVKNTNAYYFQVWAHGASDNINTGALTYTDRNTSTWVIATPTCDRNTSTWVIASPTCDRIDLHSVGLTQTAALRDITWLQKSKSVHQKDEWFSQTSI